MQTKIRFGIAGCGMISNFHAQALEKIEGAELTAAFDINPKNLANFTKKYKCRGFSDLNEMLSKDVVDAVCICTPSGLHASQTLQACRRGIHVLVEKPMALNVEDGREVVEAAEKYKVKVGVVSQLRFTEGIQRAKKYIEEGRLGKLLFGNITMHYYRSPEYYASSPWKGTWRMDGGGALMNQGIHGMDLLRYLMGDVKNVSGRMGTRYHKIEVEDIAAAVLEYENGALGTVSAATCCKPGRERLIEIIGTNGTIILEEDRIVKLEIQGEAQSCLEGEKLNNQTSNDPQALDFRGHFMQIKDFLEAITYNREPLSNAEEGLKTVKFICDIYKTARKF